MSKLKELEVIYASQKSFYKKAFVENEKGLKNLYSYGTLVATIQGQECRVYGTYSPTTLRHIKEFLKQEGFTADTKTQILKDYLFN